jgi:hypothetical protein
MWNQWDLIHYYFQDFVNLNKISKSCLELNTKLEDTSQFFYMVPPKV